MERGHRLRRLAAVLLTASLVAPGAAFGEPPVVGGEDWYASVYGVLGVPNTDASGEDPGGGAALSAGFRFNRWLASEVGGEWIYRVKYDRGTGPVSCTGTGGASDYFTTWQVTAGGRVYFTDSLVQPFLLGHGGYMQTRDRGGGKACSRDGFVARLGGGLEVFVNNEIAVSVIGAYVLPVTGGIQDHDYVTIGFGLTWY